MGPEKYEPAPLRVSNKNVSKSSVLVKYSKYKPLNVAWGDLRAHKPAKRVSCVLSGQTKG